MNPLFMIALCAVVFGWVKVINLADNNDDENPIVINGRRISANERTVIMVAGKLDKITKFFESVCSFCVGNDMLRGICDI